MFFYFRAYENKVFPGSRTKPALIMWYSDWCFSCQHLEPVWSNIHDELTPVGFKVQTMHSEHEKNLARKLSVTDPPHMIFILDQHVYHYRENLLSVQKVKGRLVIFPSVLIVMHFYGCYRVLAD